VRYGVNVRAIQLIKSNINSKNCYSLILLKVPTILDYAIFVGVDFKRAAN